MTTELPPDLHALDSALAGLFADARPSGTLEDRTIRGLRSDTRRQVAFSGWQRALAYGLAASVGLGVLGTLGASNILDRIPFPGEEGRVASGDSPFVKMLGAVDDSDAMNFDKPQGAIGEMRSRMRRSESEVEKVKELTNSDTGLDSEFKAAIDVTREALGREVNRGDEVVADKPVQLGSTVDTAKQTSDDQALYFIPGKTGEITRGTGRYHPQTSVKLNSKRSLTTATGEAPTITGGTVDAERWDNKPGAMPDPSSGTTATYNKTVTKPRFGTTTVTEVRPTTTPYLNLLRDRSGGEGENYYGLVTPTPVQMPKAPETTPQPGPPAVAPAPVVRKIIIRTGEIEFEIDSFDGAYATVQQIVSKINGAFVGTVNSDKLPNGKMKGAIVVRIPPEHLDGLVLELRRELGKTGELKGQRIAAQDITKQYTDLESRLTAARTMEKRLLKIIEEGKGEIKLLLEAEKELGVWRTKIEEAEGELRYYASQVSLSTLTIALAEKEIRAAAGLTEAERVQAGVEVEDVDAAYRDILKAVADAKGRVSKAELKQHTAGQFSATLHFEASPDAAGPLRDRLKQLGRVARLDIDRVQTADAGGTPVPKDAKVKRGDTAFFLELYNLANVQPRETVVQQVAAADVKASYQALQNAVAKAKGRVLKAMLNDAEHDAATAQFQFEINRKDEADVLTAIGQAGESVSRSVARAPESDRTTDSKIRFDATLIATGTLRPRETTAMTIEVADVEGALAGVTGKAVEAKARILDQTITRTPNGQVTARVMVAVPLTAAGALTERFKAAGVVRAQDASRDSSAVDGPAAMARISVTLTNVDPIVPSDDGLWPQVRKGLSQSAAMLLKSVTFVIIGACVVLPWALILWAGYRLFSRRKA